MASGTIFGLILMGVGLLSIFISPVVTNFAANVRANLQPDMDKASFRRRKTRNVRIIGISWMVIGAGCAIFGLVTGH